MKTKSTQSTQSIYGALAIGNPAKDATDKIDLVVSIESVDLSDGEKALPSSKHPDVDAFVKRLVNEGGQWLSARQVGTVLGLERIIAPEHPNRAFLGWRGIIPRRVYDLLREGREVTHNGTPVTLLPRERRQVLFTMADPKSDKCPKDCKDFFVLNVVLTDDRATVLHQQPYVFGLAQAHYGRA